MTVPAVIEMSSRRRMASSRFLMPVSCAAVLGGVITTIGTSTNLTVSGLLTEAGMAPLDLFELTPVRLPIASAGCVLLVFLGPLIHRDRGSARDDVEGTARDFTVTMRVTPDGSLHGVTVERAGLRHLQGVFLVEISRAARSIAPVAPDEVLEGADELTFVGRIDQVVDLQRMRGLESAERRQIEALASGGHAFYEVVVGAGELPDRRRARVASALATVRRSWPSTARATGSKPSSATFGFDSATP